MHAFVARSLRALSFIACFAASLPCAAATSTLVPAGAVWKYHDHGVDLGTAWSQPGYNDSTWASGPAKLGYGDGGEATVVSYGPNASSKFITTYFRHTFQVADPGIYQSLSMDLLRDDGCVVYLNGVEVARYNLPAGTITYSTYAPTASEYPWDLGINIPLNYLVPGPNVLAVEMHQCNATSSDLALDLRLTATMQGISLALNSPADAAPAVAVPPTLAATATHPANQNLAVSFYGRPTPPPAPNFSIVVLPDTQKYTASLLGGTPEMFISQTEWIATNREALNIAYVAHMGDITDNGDNYENQWINAHAALSKLEVPQTGFPSGIPYGLAVGNHDQYVPSGDTSPTTFYNQYFGVSRFLNRPYYGGSYNSLNNNHYDLFTAGGMDFIVVYFEFDSSPDQPVLDWADALLKTYSSRRAIVVTHYFLDLTGTFGTQGAAIYNALKDNPNLFLMLCGHNHGETRRADTFEGRTVNTLLADYQAYPNGGSGYLRIMEFVPSQHSIRIKTYSPYLDQSLTDSDSEFTLDYSMVTGPAFTLVQQNNPVTSGSQTTATWTGLSPATEYEWYVQATDGQEIVTSELRRFTTTSSSPPVVKITSPQTGASFPDFPTTVTVTADAADSDGTVQSVEFFAGSTSLGTDTTTPFAITAILAAGNYTLTAVATDDTGGKATSAPVQITVGTAPTAPAIVSASPVSRSSISLNWQDNSSNESGFRVFQSLDGNTYTLAVSAPANNTSVPVTGLAPGTTYYFYVQAFNDVGTADSASISATTAANSPPAAVEDNYSTVEDTPLVIAAPGVLFNDSDADQDPLSAALAIAPVHGSLTLNADGSFTYTPALNFSGADSFTYSATDGFSSATATVSIWVTPANDGPAAVDDTAATLQGTAVTINVLGNDSDPDGNSLAVMAVEQPQYGTATLNTDDTVTYRPNAAFTGTDSFTYTLTDGSASAQATVTVTVQPNVLFSDGFESGNFTVGGWIPTGSPTIDGTAKYAGNFGALLKRTSSITRTLSGLGAGTVNLSYARRTSSLETGDAGRVEISSDGNQWVNLESITGTTAWETRQFTRTLSGPTLHIRFSVNGSEGNDSFMVDEVSVVGGATGNAAPAAASDAFSTSEEAALSVAAPGVLANDSDPDADLLTVIVLSGPLAGSLSLNPDGSFTYTPGANFAGTDTFTYKAYDGQAYSEPATVTITVSPVNDSPVAVADSVTTRVSTPVTIHVLANDSDVDGDTLTVTAVDNVTGGSATVNTDNTVTFTPDPAFTGSASFTYTISDGNGATAAATVTVTVTALTQPPAAPTSLRSSAVTSSQISLAWTDNATNEEGYDLERSTDGSTWTVRSQLSANTVAFTDTGLSRATRYFYRVRAFNNAGSSGYSNTLSVKTSR